MWGQRKGYTFPPNEIPEIYKHIKSTYKVFYDCPYGLCWNYENKLYTIKFYVYFKGIQFAECTFDKPYVEEGQVESHDDGPDEPVDDDESDYDDEDRPERLYPEDLHARLTIFHGGHKHIDTICDCDAGEIVVPLCSSNYPRNNDGSRELRTLEDFHRLIDKNNVVSSDMNYLKQLNKVETQWIVKKVYPIIEGTGRIDEFARNQRLGTIVIPLRKTNNTYVHPDYNVGRVEKVIIEPIYEIQYYLMNWCKHIQDEIKMMRLDYTVNDDDDPWE